jgi:hypothetical protein
MMIPVIFKQFWIPHASEKEDRQVANRLVDETVSGNGAMHGIMSGNE